MLKQLLPFSILMAFILPPNTVSGQIQQEPAERYIMVEEMPYIIGCEGSTNIERRNCSKQKLTEYLEAYISQIDMEQPDTGALLVQFLIEADGSVHDVKLEKGDAFLGIIVKEAMEAMPKWVPGKQRGVAAGVLYRMPITIKFD